MTVRIWGNPRTTSNLNCLFWMYNWKWVKLSKMAGFNISLSLNERKSSSDKKHNKSLRLVLFFSFCCCFPALYRFCYRQWNKRNCSTPFPKCFHFYSEKNSLGGLSFNNTPQFGTILTNRGNKGLNLKWPKSHADGSLPN